MRGPTNAAGTLLIRCYSTRVACACNLTTLITCSSLSRLTFGHLQVHADTVAFASSATPKLDTLLRCIRLVYKGSPGAPPMLNNLQNSNTSNSFLNYPSSATSAAGVLVGDSLKAAARFYRVHITTRAPPAAAFSPHR